MIHVIIGSGLRRGLRIRVELSAGVIRDCSLTAVATVRAQAAATRRRTGQGEMTPLSSRIHRKALGPGPSIPAACERAPSAKSPRQIQELGLLPSFLSLSFFPSRVLSCRDIATGISRSRGVPTCREDLSAAVDNKATLSRRIR